MKHNILTIGILALSAISANASNPSQPQDTSVATDSLQRIIKRAELGDNEAQNQVGSWYYSGTHGVEQNYDKAYHWWSKSALNGNVLAIGNLGICYQFGRGVEKDSIDAQRLYITAISKGNDRLMEERIRLADNGSTFDQMLVATIYHNGKGTDKNDALATKYYEMAAKAQSVDGQRQLALLYMNTRQPDKAAQWFKAAADQGDLPSTYYIGRLLIDGKGIRQDVQQGVIYMLDAANRNFAQAQCDMGDLYAEGIGVRKDQEQAATWYQVAAWNNSVKGMWQLANCYTYGNGIRQDYDQALFWFAEASANGYRRSFEKFIESEIAKSTPFYNYMAGMKAYINNDYDEAMRLFKIVDKAKIADGKTMIAVCYANSKYAKNNPKKAVKELTKIADDNAAACFYLASLYEVGRGVKKDFDKALELYIKAAEMGNPAAQCYLGDIYYEGRNVEQNYQKAVDFYLAAEKQHQLNSNATKRLADCYQKGRGGLEADTKRAKTLLEKPSTNNITKLLELIK